MCIRMSEKILVRKIEIEDHCLGSRKACVPYGALMHSLDGRRGKVTVHRCGIHEAQAMVLLERST